MLLDEYEQRARLTPGLWTVLPVAVVIIALGLKQAPVISFVWGALAAIGGPIVLASFVRQRGRAVQERLFAEWGGAPTTIMLRHAGDAATAVQRESLRREMSKIVALELPTAEQESEDPVRADGVYAEVARRLRDKTLDKKRFPFLFAENKNYGYERNLLGMRPIGMTVSLVCLLVLAGVAGAYVFSRSSTAASPAIGALVVLLLFLYWWKVPDALRVRRVADSYAERLFQAGANLSS